MNQYPKKQTFIQSFLRAIEGICSAWKTERNMKVHSGIAAVMIVCGWIVKLSAVEWCICLILTGSVIALELLNTAVESVVDLVTEQFDPRAKRAKDTAAGAVLWMAFITVFVGLIIFVPKFLNMFS